MNFQSHRDGYQAEEYVQNASVLRLVFFGFLVLTPIISPGSIGAFASVCLPQMNLNLEETSWFVSLISITDPLGGLLIGFIVDKYGRRVSMLVSIIPNAVGCFLLADTNASLTRLYLSRLLSGFAMGACILPSVIYAAECITIDYVRVRSSVGTTVNLTMAIGGLLVYTLSTVLPYDRIALVLGSLSTVSLFLVLIFLPESPTWLCQKGRLGDADIAWRRLGMKRPILRNHAVRTTATASAATNVSPDRPFLKRVAAMTGYVGQIRRREVYTPLVIAIFFQFFCQFSGLYCVVNFMTELLSVPSLNVSPYALSLMGQALQIVGCLLTSSTLPALGTRALSMASFSVVSIGFIALALSSVYENSAPNILGYLYVVAVWTIMLAATGVLGIGPAMLGEMFPMGAKGFASLPLCAGSVFSFIALKMFPYMRAQYGAVVFFVFGAISACGVAFVFRCLPETVGKTMDEITQGFQEESDLKSGDNV